MNSTANISPEDLERLPGLYPRGYGGARRDPDTVKREGWREQEVLVVSAEDPRLTWTERELVRQIGEKLYGGRCQPTEKRHG